MNPHPELSYPHKYNIEHRAIVQRETEKRLLSLPFPVYPRASMPIPRVKSVPGYAEFYSACLAQPQPKDLMFANLPTYVATRGHHTTVVLLANQEKLQLGQLVHAEAARRHTLHRGNPEYNFRVSPAAIIRRAIWKYIQAYIKTGTVPQPTPHLAYTKSNNKLCLGLKRDFAMAADVTSEERSIISVAAAKLVIAHTELIRRALDAEFQLLLPRMHSSNEARKGYYTIQKIIYDLARQSQKYKLDQEKLSPRQRASIKKAKAVRKRAMEEFARWTVLEADGGAGMPEALLAIKIRRAQWELDRATVQLKACEGVV